MMAIRYGDCVKQRTSNTSGTATLTLSTAIPVGFVAFSASPTISLGATVHYKLEDGNGTAWEVGEGTVGATTLTRDTVLANHLGTTAKITLSATTHTVYCVWTAQAAYRANPALASAAISANTLTLDLRSATDAVFQVTLNANITTSGITITGAPPGLARLHVQFTQATPGGATYDVPAAAWPGSVAFDSPYQVYTDDTPTVIRAVTLDGGNTWRAETNYELSDYQPLDETLSQLSTLSGAGLLSLSAGSLTTVSAAVGLPSGSGLVQVVSGVGSTLSTATYQPSSTTLSQLSTLSGSGLIQISAGTITTASTAAYQPSSTTLSQLSTLSGSGLIQISAGTITTASTAAYQSSATLLSQLSTLSGSGVLSLSAGSLSTATVTGGGGGGGTPVDQIVRLLYSIETDTSEYNNSITESAVLRSYTVAANSYAYLLIEAQVQHRHEVDEANKSDCTWRFKVGGATVRTYIERLIAASSTGVDSGGRYATRLSCIVAGGQGVNTAIEITAQLSRQNAAIGALVQAFRVYAIENVTIGAGLPSGSGLVQVVSGVGSTLSTATYQSSATLLSQLSTLSGSGVLSLSAGSLSTATVTGGGVSDGGNLMIVAASNLTSSMTYYFAARTSL